MNLFKRWIWPRSPRSDAVSLYKAGLAYGEKKNLKGAVAAYSSAIDQLDAPEDVKAMALYNRALIFATDGKVDKAVADLRAIMEMPIPLPGVKLAARRRLERLQQRQDAATRSARHSAT